MMRISALFITGAAALRVDRSEGLIGANPCTWSPSSRSNLQNIDCLVQEALEFLKQADGPNAPPGANCAGLKPGRGQTECVVEKLVDLYLDNNLDTKLLGSDCASLGPNGCKEKVEELLELLKFPAPGEDCSGVEDKKTCKRNKAIEEALETVRADYAKDRQVCRSSLDRNHVLCVKARLKTEIAAYILQHPNIIGDFEGLKREIKNEFSAVKAGVLNKLLNALAAEIKKGDGSEGIDAGKLADLVISVATHISGDKA